MRLNLNTISVAKISNSQEWMDSSEIKDCITVVKVCPHSVLVRITGNEEMYYVNTRIFNAIYSNEDPFMLYKVENRYTDIHGEPSVSNWLGVVTTF